MFLVYGVHPKPPYKMLKPIDKPLLSVELIRNRQMCWYKTDLFTSTRTKGGNTQLLEQNYQNFGKILFDIIRVACEPSKVILQFHENEVRKALQTAYQTFIQKHPKVDYSLGDYLEAILSKTLSDVDPEQIRPVLKFIERIKAESS